MTPLAFTWPASLGIVLETVNRVFRKLLLLPDQASSVARRVDAVHYFEITVFTVIAIAYFGTAVYFAIRYRRRSAHDYTPEVRAPGAITAYTFGMLGLFMLFWLFGFLVYRGMRTAPPDAIDVYVVAKQWTWKFAYADGGASAAVLYVPVGRPVRLLLTSRDVIHSFYVPAFRVKQDAVPGTYTTAWFQADTPGAYQIMCTQMCGPGHSRMWGQVVALGAADYARWRAGEAPPLEPAEVGIDTPGDLPLRASTADAGRRAAAEFGCLKCHSIDGQPHIGPTWLGVFGSDEPLADGRTITVDAAYITRSMMDPAADVVRGFRPVMPSYQGLVTPADTAAIIEFMKALRDVQQPSVVAPLPEGTATAPNSPSSVPPARPPHGRGGGR